ncbi:MAG: SMP-30/gluconolactonase/LRE family protein [Planctomycetes bacterium]|nr:SMP-30/gluconolactonase/LRE family protein [Planctomycetota bacterium]
MARPKLVSPDQPFLIRAALRLYQFAASLKLAVVLILGMAFVLALATVVEAAWGTPAAQFGVYQTWWFNLGVLLLAVNIFCAASIRYPWKRHQTGFVITHVGLLTLLSGAAIGRFYGIDAQVFVYELGADHRAYEDQLHFRLTVDDPHDDNPQEKEIVLENFEPGVFSWPDYETMFDFNRPGDKKGLEGIAWKSFRALSGGVFWLANRTTAGDVLYDENGVKLEALNYYADSRQVSAPMVQLMLTMPSQPRIGPDGKPAPGPVRWAPFSLEVTPAPKQTTQYPNGLGARQLAGGGHLVFWLTGSREQVQAFLKGGPEGPLGEKGQVVLHAGGKKHAFLVDEKLDQGRFPLEGTDLEAELLAYWPTAELDREKSRQGEFVWTGDPDAPSAEHPAVKIALYRGDEQSGEMLLFARAPDDNIHDYKNRVFGDYWFDETQDESEENKAPIITGGGSRIDIIQGPDEKLYYRYWRRKEKQLAFARELPAHGSEEKAVAAFTMPMGQQRLYVKEFIPSTEPVAEKFMPLPFDREKNIGMRQPAAQVRLTVDGNSEEFWVLAYIGPPEETPRDDAQLRTVAGDDRVASLIMPVDSVDIGFRTRLLQFERKLDPGTSQPSHYSSTIDVLDRQRDRTIYVSQLDGDDPRDLKAPTPVGAADIASASAIAFDAAEDYLYWIDPRQKTIQRAEFEDGKLGEVVEGLVETNLRDPQDLVLDVDAGKMYWTDHSVTSQGDMGLIFRANLDGSRVEQVAQVNGFPADLALDPERQVIYWLDPWRGSISRTSYDGAQTTETVIAGLDRPGGIALDRENQHLYWTEQGDGAIRRANTDGRQEKTLVVRQQHETPAQLVLDSTNEKLYWSDVAEGPLQHREKGPTAPERLHRIRRADLDGGNVEELITRDVHEPGDLAIDPKDGRLFWAQEAAFRRDVWITMNAPIEFSDPSSQRRFRIFQEAFNGPWKPGDAQFEINVPASSEKSELYQSVLTVNYDPGRPVRNLGCLLVVLGIATMFYMRAYFFKPRRSAAETAASRPAETTPAEPQPRKKKKKKPEPVS